MKNKTVNIHKKTIPLSITLMMFSLLTSTHIYSQEVNINNQTNPNKIDYNVSIDLGKLKKTETTDNKQTGKPVTPVLTITKNGIRSDIEELINKKYINPNENKAVIQLAKYLQLSISTNVDNYTALKTTSASSYYAFKCIQNTFSANKTNKPIDVIESIEIAYINTPELTAKYKTYTQSTIGFPNPPTRTNPCD